MELNNVLEKLVELVLDVELVLVVELEVLDHVEGELYMVLNVDLSLGPAAVAL